MGWRILGVQTSKPKAEAQSKRSTSSESPSLNVFSATCRGWSFEIEAFFTSGVQRKAKAREGSRLRQESAFHQRPNPRRVNVFNVSFLSLLSLGQ